MASPLDLVPDENIAQPRSLREGSDEGIFPTNAAHLLTEFHALNEFPK